MDRRAPCPSTHTDPSSPEYADSSAVDSVLPSASSMAKSPKAQSGSMASTLPAVAVRLDSLPSVIVAQYTSLTSWRFTRNEGCPSAK